MVRSVRVEEAVEEMTAPDSPPRAVKGDECRINRSKGLALLEFVVVGSSHSTYTYSSLSSMPVRVLMALELAAVESLTAVVVCYFGAPPANR